MNTGARGNTSNPRCRNWVLTLNNYTEDEYNLILDYFKHTKHYILGREVGEENETPHLQGYFSAKHAVSFNTLKNLCSRAHWAVAKGSAQHNLKYCKKENNYVTNITEDVKDVMLETLSRLEWRDWQKEIISILDGKPDDRKIYWYWDEVGGNGKTTLAKYLCLKHKDCVYIGGKASDMKYAICEMEQKPRTVIIDITRSQEHYISYQGIEEVKNGIFFNTKYESKMVIYDIPHIIIFANFKPDVLKLSIDRWEIININNRGE